MPRKVRSMRGVVLDFDLLKIKEQMAAVPAPQELRAREDFIEKRLCRRVRRAKVAVVEAGVEVEPKIVDEAEPVAEMIEAPVKTVEAVVEPSEAKSVPVKKKKKWGK